MPVRIVTDSACDLPEPICEELGIEVVLGRTLGGDELEAFAQCSIGRQAGDQDLGDLAARDNPVAGIASVAAIALEECQSVLV